MYKKAQQPINIVDVFAARCVTRADEMVMDDFHCALQKKLLLQGRMYVFERTVCFHCNLFGYTKDKVIPLEEVTSVRKRKNYGFPNSIEIIWRGKKEFFTSFLSREDAYRLIMCAWHQCSPIARHALETHRPSKGTGHRRSASSPVGVSPRFDGHTAFDAALAMEAPSSEGTKAKCGIHRFSWRSERHLTTGPAAKPDMGNSSGQPSARSSGDGTMSAPEDNMRTFSSDETIPAYTRDSGGYTGDSEAGSVLRMVTQSEDGFGFGDDNNSDNESDSSPDGHRWLAEDTPAPPVAPASHPLVTGTLDCSVVEFCQRFLADQAQFFIDFHESRGDKKVQFSEWRQHAPLGRVRDLQFIAPIKAVIGPSQTHCHQTQRYHLYAGEQLVFETSQVMTDIPYGDHFTVEARWDVTNLPTAPEAHPQVGVKSYVAIPFTKNTVWRRAIEKGAMDQCREAHTALMEHFRRVCKAQQPRPKRPSAMVTTSSPRQAKHVQIAGIEQVSPAGEQQEELSFAPLGQAAACAEANSLPSL
ncbi:hypothetical protein WJX72_001963 [[Myrmecia] bisecta]|uniref:VASt domain-containing protein n=1 Tax=[Myrmecia] bisecta TaxID=41462 RepID=A0AAW1QP61_9CHLO